MSDLIKLNLQFFAEGGDAGGGTSYGEDGTGENFGADAEPHMGEDNQGLDARDQENERRNKFEELIKGEYKDLYDQRVQDTIHKRLKGSKETVDKFNSLAPTLELLAGKYGTKPGDIEALNAAIEADDSFYEDEAFERGLPTEEVKRMHQMERENKAMKERLSEQDKQRKAQATAEAWAKEAQELKDFYPDFDLKAELAPGEDGKPSEFQDLVQRGYSMKKAYQLVHMDEIMQGAMKYTAERMESSMAKSIASGGRRPIEAFNGGRSPAIVKKDVSQLTDEDLDEISDRVHNGEIISFG